MMSFLETVVAEKRRELAAKQASVSFDAMRERALRADPPRDFLAAVSRHGAVIAELKVRTPTIASFANAHSLLDLAATYQANGASAISIVTDPARFGTSYADIARVRDVAGLPVIAKDFVIDPYQIVEARAAHADAMLLIVRLLELEACWRSRTTSAWKPWWRPTRSPRFWRHSRLARVSSASTTAILTR
jgi:indole-3-glycerol phosphate synthase